MEPEPHKAPLRFYEIDLLRFLAALAVVLYHYTYRGYMQGHFSPVSYPALAPVTKYGWLGVELFFMISGYVVLMSAMGKTIKQFFLSRVTRLYPAFWVACTLTFLVMRFFGPREHEPFWSLAMDVPVREYLANLTMLPEFVGVELVDSSYWSLTVEITFYFVVSLFIGYGLFSKLPAVLLAWLLYCAAAGPVPASTSMLDALLFPKYAPYFIGGMLFYLLQRKSFSPRLLVPLLGFALLLSMRCVRFEVRVVQAAFQDTSISLAVATGAVVAFYLLFWLLISRRLDLSRFTWLAQLGSLTYPLYLIHAHIGWVVYEHAGTLVNKYLLLGALLTGMLLVAYLINRLVERPFSKPLGALVGRLLAYPASRQSDDGHRP